MSAIVTSGVASFSTYRASRGSHAMGMRSPSVRDARAARGAQRRERVVVNLAAGHDRDLLVEQIDQAAQDPAFRLAAQAEQDEVVPREDRVDELRDDRLVEADDAREEPVAGPELPHQVVANLLLDRTRPGAGVRAKVAEGLNGSRHEPILLH